MSITPQTKSLPPVLFFGQSLRKWTPGTQTRRSAMREHHKQHRHTHPRCVSPSPHLQQFRHDLQQQAVPELHLGSPPPPSLQFSLQGHMEVDGNGKWVPAELTTDSVSASEKVISSCRFTLSSDIPWNSKTWLSIDGFTYLINLSLTHSNLMNLSASNDVRMIFQGYVEEWN